MRSAAPSSTPAPGVTVAQLKDRCRARGLKVGGTKAALRSRLMRPSAEDRRVFERSIDLVDAEANLDDVLRIFKRGRGHLALVLGQEVLERVARELAQVVARQRADVLLGR